MKNSKIVNIVLGVLLVVSLGWGITSNNKASNADKKNAATVARLERAEECIDDWANLTGQNSTDYYGNPVWIVPDSEWARFGDACDPWMG